MAFGNSFSRDRARLLGALVLLSLPSLAVCTEPLVIDAQGSFFVGGEVKRAQIPATVQIPELNGDITVNQMYVQYQIPVQGHQHVPVVMVHGCCLSSKSWETTPDGRMGWSEYFVRRQHPVYLADQVSRARSGFDPTSLFPGSRPVGQAKGLSPIVVSTHQLAWTMFRFGPNFGEAFADGKFPIQAVQEFYKQMIPDLNWTLPQDANPTWTALAALAANLKGAVLMGHSEAGFFPERAALVDPTGVKGIISIETQCAANLEPEKLRQLARIPILIMFGDHLGDITFKFRTLVWTWADMLQTCRAFAKQVRKFGGDVELVHLPKRGITGNSHMLMQDVNNIELADLVIAWINDHVEERKVPPISKRSLN